MSATSEPGKLDPSGWVEKHGDYLYGLAQFRVRDSGLAEDLVQETLIAAFKGHERYEGRSNERTWLTAILKNKIRDYFRKKRRDIPLSELMPDDPDPEGLFDSIGHINVDFAPKDWGSDPIRALDRSEFRTALQKCLGGLPDRTAEVFMACEVQGESTEDIAARYNLTRNNTWVLLHRARQMLRQCLEKNWYTP